MEKNKMIVMLQYRIQRYQSMGNGPMCKTTISTLLAAALRQSATSVQAN